MAETATEMVAIRLEPAVRKAIDALARRDGIEGSAYVLRLVRLHAASSGLMAPADCDRILTTESLIQRAVSKARELDAAGAFDQNFTLTVIRALFEDADFRADYERIVGGDANTHGLPGKASLNMSLGWHIKSAVGADPVPDEKGNPRRVQIRNAPIQSYTLLTKPQRPATP